MCNVRAATSTFKTRLSDLDPEKILLLLKAHLWHASTPPTSPTISSTSSNISHRCGNDGRPAEDYNQSGSNSSCYDEEQSGQDGTDRGGVQLTGGRTNDMDMHSDNMISGAASVSTKSHDDGKMEVSMEGNSLIGSALDTLAAQI
jgi:hypothetical protein